MKTTDNLENGTQAGISMLDPRGKAGSLTSPASERRFMNGLEQFLRAHPFFSEMKPEHLSILASGAKSARFEPRQLLFRQGEPANQFYLIESGKIALEAHEPADGTVLVQTIGAGDVLGWSWLFPPFVWHFQARAIEPSAAIILSGAHLLMVAEQNHEFGYELMKRVAQVVIQRLQATRKQLLAREIEAALKE